MSNDTSESHELKRRVEMTIQQGRDDDEATDELISALPKTALSVESATVSIVNKIITGTEPIVTELIETRTVAANK